MTSVNKSLRMMAVILLTVFVTTACNSQITQHRNMTEHEGLSSQAGALAQLIEDAIPILKEYKRTKSREDGYRYDEQLSQIATHWQNLLETYEQIDEKKIKETYEKIGDSNNNKKAVLHNETITMRWVLSALQN